MIKLVLAGGDDRKLLLLGLTVDNIARLLKHEPILITLDDMATVLDDTDLTELRIVITYGATQNEILRDVKTNLGVENMPSELREPGPGETIQIT